MSDSAYIDLSLFLEEKDKQIAALKEEIELLKSSNKSGTEFGAESLEIINLLKAENEKLLKIQDMDAAIINGMRRVLATSRMALNGNILPLKLALDDFEKCKLQDHNQRIEALAQGKEE